MRKRETDVQLIMESLLARYAAEDKKRFKKFSPDATQLMMDYDWPGNVRQLQNIVRNIVVLHDGDEVLSEMIPAPVRVQDDQLYARTTAACAPPLPTASPTVDLTDTQHIKPLWLVEKEVIEHTIELCKGNIPKAAALLDVSASTIYRKKEKWS